MTKNVKLIYDLIQKDGMMMQSQKQLLNPKEKDKQRVQTIKPSA